MPLLLLPARKRMERSPPRSSRVAGWRRFTSKGHLPFLLPRWRLAGRIWCWPKTRHRTRLALMHESWNLCEVHAACAEFSHERGPFIAFRGTGTTRRPSLLLGDGRSKFARMRRVGPAISSDEGSLPKSSPSRRSDAWPSFGLARQPHLLLIMTAVNSGRVTDRTECSNIFRLGCLGLISPGRGLLPFANRSADWLLQATSSGRRRFTRRGMVDE